MDGGIKRPDGAGRPLGYQNGFFFFFFFSMLDPGLSSTLGT